MLLVVGIVLFVFLIQRPMKKQQEAQRKLRESVSEGGRVMLTSGLFGTVRHLGDKQAVVELAPGLEVTVLRQAIARTVAPEDEEFEYADEVPADVETDDAASMPAHEAGFDTEPPAPSMPSEPSDAPDRPSSI